MIACAPCLQSGKSLSFIAHHVIADLESVFPEFAGEITYDSIGFGSGSLFGLHCLARSSKKRGPKAKFEYLHEELSAKMLKLDPIVLEILGWKLDEELGRVVSIVTGRAFSMTDTEHICCKVYVCIANSHPSRTISDTPRCSSGYCWPLPDNHGWAEQHEKFFRVVLRLFRGATFDETCPVRCIMKEFPHQLQYQNGNFV